MYVNQYSRIPYSLLYIYLLFYFLFSLDFYWNTGNRRDKRKKINNLTQKNTGNNTGNLLEYSGNVCK